MSMTRHATIDPEAFTLPERRICVGPGEREEVYGALSWGMPERDPHRDPDDPYGDLDAATDPLMQLWSTHPGDTAGTARAEYGYTMTELQRTRKALVDSQSDDDSEHRAADLEVGLAIVDLAIEKLKEAP